MSKARTLPARKKYGYQPISSRSKIRRSQSSVDNHSMRAAANAEEAREGLLRVLKSDPPPVDMTPIVIPDLEDLPVPGSFVSRDVGLGHSALDTPTRGVEADTTIAKPRRGRPKKVVVEAAPVTEPTELEEMVEALREDLYEWRQVVAHRVATINRLKAMCRKRIVTSLRLPAFLLKNKGEDLKDPLHKKQKAVMDAESKALFDALIKGDIDGHPLFLKMVAVTPLVDTISQCEETETTLEKRMATVAKRLPVAKWAVDQFGFSLVGLAKIIGYAGDLNRFCDENTGRIMPSKLWKFMELAVIDGERQRRIGGDAALVHNYKGHKRSLMWNVGCSLIGGMGRGPRLEPEQDIRTSDLKPWQRRFYQHMRFYADRNPELHRKPVGENGKESFSKHAWAMSKRRVEKEFLVALQIAWRDATKPEITA